MTLVAASGCAVLVVMLLAFLRALAGPTLYDRVLAVNLFGSKTVLLLCILDALYGAGAYLDIALVYALINYIGVIAMLRFYRPETPGTSSTDCP